MAGNTSKRYPAELKQRAVRMYGEIRPDQETDTAAMTRVAELLGMDLLRLGLERAATAAEAVDIITALLERHDEHGGEHGSPDAECS